MTKKEKAQVDAFFKKIIKHKKRRFVDAKVFDKRFKGQLIVLPIANIIREYTKLVNQVNGK